MLKTMRRRPVRRMGPTTQDALEGMTVAPTSDENASWVLWEPTTQTNASGETYSSEGDNR